MFNIELSDNEDFSIVAECVGGVVFLHCSVHNKTKSVLKRIKDEFEVIREEFCEQGFPRLYCYTSNLRFVEFLKAPFDIIGREEVDGDAKEVIVWQHT